MADSSKTEQATPKRRSKAREKGQVARSRELPGVFALAGVAGATGADGVHFITHWTTFYRNTLYVASTGNFESNGPCSSGARLK
jgi:flagellar biosynthetic protein FlhB